MELSISQKFDRLTEKVIKIKKDTLLEYLECVVNLTKDVTNFLYDDDVTGFERITNIGTGSESSGITSGQGTNPLLWVLGHISYFYDYHCLKNLLNNHEIMIKNG